MQPNPPTPSDSKSTTRTLARTTGILFVAAVVLLSFSGAAAPAIDLPTTELVDTDGGEDATHRTMTKGPQVPDTMTKGPEDIHPTDAAERLSFETGDRLTEEQLAEYHAYIAALKAKGLHKGPAVYSSW